MNLNSAVNSNAILIKPEKGWISLKLKNIWEYRELLYFLVWRDVKVRYKQTIIGMAWAIIQPLFTMVIFTIIFAKLVRVPTDGIPYPIFSYVALLPWQYFSGSINRTGGSLVSSAHLISKVYFPRLIIPISSCLSGLIDFGIAFLVLIGMMFYYGIIPTLAILTLPFLLIFAMITALSIGLWLSAMNVKYRDVGHLIPFLVQIWLFASPVAYPTSLVPEKWRMLYSLNPMAGVIEGFRWALLSKSSAVSIYSLFVSIAIVLILLVGGAFYFRRMEKTFADVI